MKQLAFCVFALILVSSCKKYDSPDANGVNPATVRLNVSVKLNVGETSYGNIDTRIVVAGYDAQNTRKWEQSFDYAGPDINPLSIKTGFDWYTIELSHWGIQDTLRVSASDLLRDRSDGPAPQTYLLTGSKDPKRLSYYLQYFETVDTVHGGTYMKLSTKVEFLYGEDGKVTRRNVYQAFDTAANPVLFAANKFVYDEYHQLNRIDDYFLNPVNGQFEFQNQANYHYNSEGLVSQIENQIQGISNTQITYGSDVKAVYTFSNGSVDESVLHVVGQNIASSQETFNGQLCNQGAFTYDKNINPLKNLYLDVDLKNISINNRKQETVDYVGCAFPSLIPVFHAYDYDEDGYPAHERIHFAPKGTSRIDYFYIQ